MDASDQAILSPVLPVLSALLRLFEILSILKYIERESKKIFAFPLDFCA